jgi:hypothetical protein
MLVRLPAPVCLWPVWRLLLKIYGVIMQKIRPFLNLPPLCLCLKKLFLCTTIRQFLVFYVRFYFGVILSSL